MIAPGVRQQRTIRIVELALVLCVAFLPAIITSIILLFIGIHEATVEKFGAMEWQFFLTGVEEALALAVFLYVLFRQHRSARAIGFSFSWKDIPRALGIVAVVYFSLIVAGTIIGVLFPQADWISQMHQRTAFLIVPLNVGMILFLLLNAFFEELIVRAFLISEVKALFKKPAVAVILSTLVQASYHLYQGWQSAVFLSIVFFIFSLYFVKYGRIMPVIMAHATIDCITFLLNQ